MICATSADVSSEMAIDLSALCGHCDLPQQSPTIIVYIDLYT